MYNKNIKFDSFLCVCIDKSITNLKSDIYLNSFTPERTDCIPFLWVKQQNEYISIDISENPLYNTNIDFEDIQSWIICNKKILLQHWNGLLTDKEILNHLSKGEMAMIKVEENKRINEDLKKLYEDNTEKFLELWKECFETEENKKAKDFETAPNRINEFGIIDPQKFDTDNGILVIGKETNGWSNKAYTNPDEPLFREWLYNMATTQEITGEIAKKHPQIWYNLGRWAKFIVNQETIDKQELLKEKKTALEGLGYIAFTNINKVRGKNSSKKEYKNLLQKNVVKKILIQEIEYIKPKVIILCGISEEYLKGINSSIKVIKMPHPSARNISKSDMLQQLEEQLSK